MKQNKLSQFSKRIIISAIILLSIYFLGSAGYMIIEDMSLLDAFFMTTITITTVGYGVVKDLSRAGIIYTIFLIIIGTGMAAYILINLTDFILSEFLLGKIERRRTSNMISKYKEHYIICGLGRVGLEIAKELAGKKIDFIVLDKAEEPIEKARQNNWLYIQGDASDDEKLIDAGIKKARGLFAALDSDSENVYVTLSAKSLNPDIFVVARATGQETAGKLERAGADRVISPQVIGGRRMAAMALLPSVCDFLDTLMKTENVEMQLAEIDIKPGSRLDNISLREAVKKYGIEGLIVSILEKGEKVSVKKAGGDTKISSGQKLIAIGTGDQVRELEDLASK